MEGHMFFGCRFVDDLAEASLGEYGCQWLPVL